MLYLNGQPVPITMFPDNTSQVWKLPKELISSKFRQIEWNFDNEGQFLQLAQLLSLLESVDTYTGPRTLELTYLPYGRQDKEISNESTFALRTFASFLNILNFDRVIIHDPHSEIALKLIKNSEAVYPVKLVETSAQLLAGEIVLCYPDKGAVTKYTKVYESLYRPHIYGEKVRDQSTGNILSYQVVGECLGKNVLIVDDICDGGATFKILAKDLLAAGATQVNLFVTHGLFSRGVKTLLDSGITRIFTAKGEAFNGPDDQVVYRRWEI